MESSSNHMASLFKIEFPTSGWVKPLKILLNTIKDVDFKIDKRSKTVYIYGKTNPEIILEKITKEGLKAEIVWSNYGCKENKSRHLMGQCNSSGYINNGQYHQFNGPSPYWMYQQPQPYQTFGFPAPYPFQIHPQPYQTFGFPAPYPFQIHPQPPPPQKELVAKSFPPTPAPPKNFTMGDLHPGCKIM